MEGGEGSGNMNTYFMAFGENGNGFCPMMMMPQVAATGPNGDCSQTLFLPLPSTNQQHLNRNSSSAGGCSMMLAEHNNNMSTGYYFMEGDGGAGSCSIKSKIMAHPHYPRLLAAYVNCQKAMETFKSYSLPPTDDGYFILRQIGAPPEVVTKLEEACASATAIGRSDRSSVGEDPALDQFMEAYCEMLTKYEQELSKPFKEAMLFLSRIECQFKALTLSNSDSGGKPSTLSLSLSIPFFFFPFFFIFKRMKFILLISLFNIELLLYFV